MKSMVAVVLVRNGVWKRRTEEEFVLVHQV